MGMDEIHQRLRSLAPDLLLRQEMGGCARSGRGSELWYASERALGMRGFLGPGPGATALYINPDVLSPTRDWENEAVGLGSVWTLPPTVVSFQMGSSMPLVCGSVHLSYHSPGQRELEAEWLTRLPDKWFTIDDQTVQRPVIIGGDFNSDPLSAHDELEWEPSKLAFIKDPPHRAHRTRRDPFGTRVLDTVPDEILHTAGLHDPARYLANIYETTAALAPTTKDSPTRGTARRCDRFYLSAALMPAVKDVDVIDMGDLADHHTARLRLRYDDTIDRLSRWPLEQRAAGHAMAAALR